MVFGEVKEKSPHGYYFRKQTHAGKEGKQFFSSAEFQVLAVKCPLRLRLVRNLHFWIIVNW